MSSTTRLLVLGVVKLFQPVHGYVVRRELISWRAQEWASVQPGSIYNALKTLTRDGLLEVASTDQVGGRPERTTYQLTQAGLEEFHTLLREEWWTVRSPIDPLMAAVSFLSEISRAEAIAALEHRAAQIHGMVRHVEFAIDSHDGSDSPYHVREMMRLMNARVSAELAWSQQFIERLRRREYATADEPPWQPTRPSAAATGSRTRRGTKRSGRAARGADRVVAERAAPRPAERAAARPAVRAVARSVERAAASTDRNRGSDRSRESRPRDTYAQSRSRRNRSRSARRGAAR